MLTIKKVDGIISAFLIIARQGQMQPAVQPNIEYELGVIEKRVKTILASGYGEVRILIKNRVIYRILSTEDELIKEKIE